MLRKAEGSKNITYRAKPIGTKPTGIKYISIYMYKNAHCKRMLVIFPVGDGKIASLFIYNVYIVDCVAGSD